MSRYAREFREVKTAKIAASICIVAIPSILSVSLGRLTILELVCVLVGALGLGFAWVWLPSKLKLVGMVICFVVGLTLYVLLENEPWVFLIWLLAVPLGLLLGVSYGQRPDSKMELQDAGRSQTHHNKSDQIIENEGKNLLRGPLVTVQAILSKISALDGTTRTAVSLFSRDCRLDVVGDARDRLMVYFSDEPSKPVPIWSLLTDPQAGDTEVEVVVAGQPGTFTMSSTVPLAMAQQAVAYFLKHQQKDPALTWDTSKNINDMRSPQLQSWK